MKENTELPWNADWKEMFPEANQHEVDMLSGRYGTYARCNFRKEVERGNYVFGTMT